MHIFEVIGAGAPRLPVFAESYDGAVQIYMAWWLTHRTTDLPDLEVRLRNPCWPGFDLEHVRAALASNIAGVGRYDRQQGWTIVSRDEGDEDVG
jgi:hypothetical protein